MTASVQNFTTTDFDNLAATTKQFVDSMERRRYADIARFDRMDAMLDSLHRKLESLHSKFNRMLPPTFADKNADSTRVDTQLKSTIVHSPTTSDTRFVSTINSHLIADMTSSIVKVTVRYSSKQLFGSHVLSSDSAPLANSSVLTNSVDIPIPFALDSTQLLLDDSVPYSSPALAAMVAIEDKGEVLQDEVAIGDSCSAMTQIPENAPLFNGFLTHSYSPSIEQLRDILSYKLFRDFYCKDLKHVFPVIDWKLLQSQHLTERNGLVLSDEVHYQQEMLDSQQSHGYSLQLLNSKTLGFEESGAYTLRIPVLLGFTYIGLYCYLHVTWHIQLVFDPGPSILAQFFTNGLWTTLVYYGEFIWLYRWGCLRISWLNRHLQWLHISLSFVIFGSALTLDEMFLSFWVDTLLSFPISFVTYMASTGITYILSFLGCMTDFLVSSQMGCDYSLRNIFCHASHIYAIHIFTMPCDWYVLDWCIMEHFGQCIAILGTIDTLDRSWWKLVARCQLHLLFVTLWCIPLEFSGSSILRLCSLAKYHSIKDFEGWLQGLIDDVIRRWLAMGNNHFATNLLFQNYEVLTTRLCRRKAGFDTIIILDITTSCSMTMENVISDGLYSCIQNEVSWFTCMVIVWTGLDSPTGQVLVWIIVQGGCLENTSTFYIGFHTCSIFRAIACFSMLFLFPSTTRSCHMFSLLRCQVFKNIKTTNAQNFVAMQSQSFDLEDKVNFKGEGNVTDGFIKNINWIYVV